MNARLLAVALSASLLAACSGADSNDDDGSLAEEELRTAGISSISAGRSVGFRPPPPEGSCWDGGRWSVDYATKALTGQGCIDGQRREIDRTLSTEEFAQVKTAVSKVRTTRAPAACPTDVPVASLDVVRGNSQTHYVEARSACGGSTPVVAAGLGKLIELLETLAKEEASGGEEDLTSNKALGLLSEPGERLNGKTFKMLKGKTLSFESAENQIRCIRNITIEPSSHVSLDEEVITPREEGQLGGSTRIRRTLKVSRTAPTGAVIKITSESCFQVRNNPAWNLDFTIKVK